MKFPKEGPEQIPIVNEFGDETHSTDLLKIMLYLLVLGGEFLPCYLL